MLPFALESPVAGRYAVVARVGSGGMGKVLRARDLETEATVALKLLDSDESPESARARFRHEVETLAELDHAGIVRHLGHGFTETGQPWLVMEWIEGGSLRARLEGSVLEVDELLCLLRALSEALAVAHERGILHRDLKPSNILLRDGRLDQPVLIDFGVARRMLAKAHITRTGAVIGTPVYMAPEQARGEAELSLSADIFALGCLAFQGLIGYPPFAAEHVASVLARILFETAPSVCELRSKVPPALGELIARMLSRDPAARPANAGQLHDELLALDLDDVPRPGRRWAQTLADHTLVDLSFVDAPAVEQQLLCVLVGLPLAEHESAAEMADAVQAMGGQAERLLDGSLIATFTTQTNATDRALLAARCALDLRRRWPSYRLALTTGRGHVRDGHTIGEAVDRAHQLLAAAEGDAIRLDELSADLLDPRFEIEAETEDRRLVRERPADRQPRRLLGKPMPCLGRAHELGLLELTASSTIEDHEAHLVLVSGATGCGKSRVRHELLRRCQAAHPELLILRGDGDPMSAGSPYAVLGSALRRAADVEVGQSPAARREALAELVARWCPRASPVTLEFATELCGLPHAETTSPALRAALDDPNLMRERCLQTWIELLTGALEQGPVLVVAEDLHWGDPSTLELLLHGHTRLAERQLMILGLTRPELFETQPEFVRELDRGRNRQHLRLAGLSPQACERLVRRALQGVLEPTDTLVARLVDHASGNALHLEELIRAAAAGGHDNFPSTVSAMLQARMEQLDRVARRTLLAASVLGSRFSIAALRPLLDGVQQGVLRLAIEGLIDAEMLEVPSAELDRGVSSRELRFRNALVRDAAYQLLSTEGARELHQAAAEYMITHHRGSSIAIAEHLAHAGQLERAASYYLRAAEQASAANVFDEALRRAQKGLSCSPVGETASHLNAIRVWALSWEGHWDEVVSLVDETLAGLPPGSPWWCRCLGTLIGISLLSGDETMLGHVTQVLFAADPREDALVPYLDALNVGIGSGTLMGRNGHVARYHRRLLEVTGRVEPGEDIRRLLSFAAASLAFHVELDPEAGLRAAQMAVELAREVGDGRYELFAHACVGLCHVRLGQLDAGLEIFRGALAKIEPLANAYLITYARAELASCLLLVPDSREAIDEAIALSSKIIEVPAIPAPYPGWARAIRARGLLLRGEPISAGREIRQALLALSAAPRLACRAWLTLARIQRELGELEGACEAADAALELIARERGWEQLDALLLATELHAARGDACSARASADALTRERDALLGRITDPAARARVEATFTPKLFA